jgi:trimethylamine--corrinoid protein Co-methyltransferase
MVQNTTKPIVFTSDNGPVCRQIIDMAGLVVGGMDRLREKPFILGYSQPTSPLQHSEDAFGKVFACAESGIPVVYPPGMIPGATAPTTIAGAIVQSLAESFSALTAHQLKAKGAPIVLCGAHGCMDMKTSINVYAAPERLMTQSVLASVYQYFGIPTWGFSGSTDALNLDEQAGMEFGMMGMWAALCGINLAHDVGYLASGMAGDLRAIVFNDEVNSYVRHMLSRGLPVSSETLAIDVLERVGPGGNFLTDQHTFDHFRKDLWRPNFLNRKSISTLTDKGEEKALKEKLGEKVNEILKTHQPNSLDPTTVTELQRALAA